MNLIESQEFSRQFASALKQRRLELGISHEKLAQASGISRSAISMIESGQRSASLITCHALAKTLNTTVSTLARQVEEEPQG